MPNNTCTRCGLEDGGFIHGLPYGHRFLLDALAGDYAVTHKFVAWGPPKTLEEWLDYWTEEATAAFWDRPGVETRDEFRLSFRQTVLAVIRDAGLLRLQEKYRRVRTNVRNISRVLREKRYTIQTARYHQLLRVAESLTWTAGKAYGEARGYTWVRLETDEFNDFNRWKTGSSVRNRVISAFLEDHTKLVVLSRTEFEQLEKELHVTERWVDSKSNMETLLVPYNQIKIPVQWELADWEKK